MMTGNTHSTRWKPPVHGIAATALIFLMTMGLVPTATANVGEVLSHQKISDTEGGFLGGLTDDDRFGTSITVLGDLDGNGVTDLALGVPGDDDGGFDRGAVWIVFLNSDGTVVTEQKINGTVGGFTGVLEDYDRFGSSVTSLGDLDGDGITDLAVGAYQDDDGGIDRGAIWILFLNSDGTVKTHQKISDTSGGLTAGLNDDDRFGAAAANLGDIDGDTVADLAIGAYWDGDGGPERGAVWVLFINSDGTVKSHQKISDTQGGFTAGLDDVDRFGAAVASLGDLDGDGITDLAVGAYQDDDGGLERGAVWILFLNNTGTVKAHQKISDTEGGFTGVLDNDDRFCSSVTALGDLDGDGITDLAVGAYRDSDGGLERGAVWILFLDSDGKVKAHQKISDIEGDFTGGLADTDRFGSSVASLGDLDGDGAIDLAAGAYRDNDGGIRRGAVWMLFLDRLPDVVVSADLTCLPSSGTLPFSSTVTVTLGNNYTGMTRRMAASLQLTLASGQTYHNWRAGFTNVPAGGTRVVSWVQALPALSTMVGDNVIHLVVEDVTPSPFNQPPHPPSGDSDSASCTVTGTGIAP